MKISFRSRRGFRAKASVAQGPGFPVNAPDCGHGGEIMKAPWTHHVRVVNGFRMHYVVSGSGPALVLLHG
jgi:hypothetical protein